MKKPLILTKLFSRAGFLIFALCILGCTILSCNQDDIFYQISIDRKPNPPLIPGTPTQMVVVHNKVYVGTYPGKKIYFYTGDSWDSMDAGGAVGGLATDNTNLYALVLDNDDRAVIKEYDANNGLTNTIQAGGLNDNYRFQSIYGAGGEVFLGAMHKSDITKFALFRCDSGSLQLILPDTSLLTGAAEAGGTVFLATSGHGIYRYPNINDAPLTAADGPNNIVGIIASGGVIVATANETSGGGGRVYKYISNSLEEVASLPGLSFTGGMGVWKAYDGGQWKAQLLLLGLRGQGSSLVHGYHELSLGADESPDGAFLRSPGSPPSSVSNHDVYEVTIGKHPVNHILQVPPDLYSDYASSRLAGDSAWKPPVFASTQLDGLWSYKKQSDGEWSWNAEN